MRCLYCGKKLSFLRKFAGGQFCSEEHRESHQRLQDELALGRLTRPYGASSPGPLSRRRTASGTPAPGKLPYAPLLPQEAPWTDCRRLLAPPAPPAPFRADHYIPGSRLRVAVHGFLMPGAAPWKPAPPPAPAAAVLDFQQPAPLLAPMEPGAKQLHPDADGGRPPSLRPLLAFSVQPARRGSPSRLQPMPLRRRRLVVVVPRSGLAVQPRFTDFPAATQVPPRPSPLPPPPMPAASPRPLPPPDPDAAPPRCALGTDPPEWLRIARPGELPTALEKQPFKLFPPLASPLPLALPPPVCVLPEARFFAADPLPENPGDALLPPFRAGAGRALQLALGGSAGIDCPPADSPLGPRICGGWVLEGLSVPRLRFQLPPRIPAWPRLAGPASVPASPLPSSAGLRTGAPAALRQTHESSPLAPLPARIAPARRLRQAQQLAPLSASVAASPCPAPARWNAFLLIAPLEAVPLRSGLVPLPPQPGGAPLQDPAEAGSPDLWALPLAAARSHLEPPGSAADVVQPGAAGMVACGPDPATDAPAASLASVSADPDSVPALCRRLPALPVRPVDRPGAAAPSAASSARPCWDSLDSIRQALPQLRLELDHADGSGPRRHAGKRFHTTKSAAAPGRRRFWASTPPGLKWITVALPLLLVVALYSFRAGKPNNPAGGSNVAHAAAPAATNAGQPRPKANPVLAFIMRRAGIRLFDDFRGGLGGWQGRDGWAGSWRYGDATFIQPGDLALLSSSLRLTDYSLSFLGQIERRSLNWVFRARDLDNYYAMRIVITRGGPLPEAVLVRSVVLGGKERESKTLPVPFPVQADTLYLVRMEIRGNDFTTFIQNQVVDHFSDHRLQSGGVGFFSPRGDRALLRWVEVSHQYDYIGRLCALLSPYGVQALPAD